MTFKENLESQLVSYWVRLKRLIKLGKWPLLTFIVLITILRLVGLFTPAQTLLYASIMAAVCINILTLMSGKNDDSDRAKAD